MDIRGLDGARADTGHDPMESGIGEATVAIGSDERRMHVRAYNHWVSLLDRRDYPSVTDLDPAGNADFGAHGVLLDFTDGIENPTIRFLGRALRDECALEHRITRIADVPARSLLSRLTDHYLQIIANRAPIGFEAEFVGTRGHYTMYRGILMPFSSDGATIDFVYGVINWKELVGEEEQAKLTAELAAAVRTTAVVALRPESPVAIWADGPSAGGNLQNPAALPDRLHDRPAIATVALDVPARAGDLVVLLARAGENGVLDILGAVDGNADLAAQAAAALR